MFMHTDKECFPIVWYGQISLNVQCFFLFNYHIVNVLIVSSNYKNSIRLCTVSENEMPRLRRK